MLCFLRGFSERKIHLKWFVNYFVIFLLFYTTFPKVKKICNLGHSNEDKQKFRFSKNVVLNRKFELKQLTVIK